MAKCQACGSGDIYKSKQAVATSGGYGPNLLPGFNVFSGTTMVTHVCTNCGLMQHYANEKARTKISVSRKWEKVTGR